MRNTRSGTRLLSAGIVAAITALLLVLGTGCARHGKEIFLREGCATCHRFREIGSGGAPDLTDVASRRTPEWMRRQFTDPTGNDPRSRMPPYPGLTWFETRSLERYLLSR